MRPSRLTLFATVGLMLLLTACGGEVTVRVMQGAAEGEAQPVADLPVEFLPFNRDSIFDELAAGADEPEPQIPEEIRTAFDSVQTLQGQWRQAESRWRDVRTELRNLSDRLQGMSSQSEGYRELFRRFNELEAREQQLARTKEQAFERFDNLQRVTLSRADSIRAVRDAWADVAFQDYTTIVDSILEAEGREIRSDTTDAEGYARGNLPGGQWWVYTRTEVPYGELYWNVALSPAEADTLVLDTSNAERRLQL